MKNTNPTPTASTAAPASLTTKHLSQKFGLKPTALRRVLRSMPQYADGVHTNYRWQGEHDPAIALIAKAIEANKARKAAAKVAAQAALAKAAATPAK